MGEMEDKKRPDWLPVGWVMEIKVRKTGQKDRCYIAPLTGRKFYSKKKVFQYLKTVKPESDVSKEKKRGTGMHSSKNVVVEEITDGELPTGWIKEVVIRKTADHVRKDPQYIDPVSGRIFRSRKEVFRYLQDGELGKRTLRPKKRVATDMELDGKVTPPIKAKKLKLSSCTRRRLFGGCISKSNGMVENQQCLEPSETEERLSPCKHVSNQIGDGSHLSTLALVKTLCNGGFKKHRSGKAQLGSNKSKGKKEMNLPRRASKRLAALKADPALKPHSSRQAHLGDKQSDEFEASNEGNSLGSWVHCESLQLEVKPEVECAPPPCNKCISLVKEPSKGNKTTCPDPTSRGTELKSDNLAKQFTPEEHSDKHEVDIQSSDMPQSSYSLPFGDSWPDPVLEFAFKTLTGAIPLEDNLPIENYFQQHLSTKPSNRNVGLELPDFHPEGFTKTNPVHGDPSEAPLSRQLLPVKPTFSHLGNIGLPGSDENSLQQPRVQGITERQRQGQLSH